MASKKYASFKDTAVTGKQLKGVKVPKSVKQKTEYYQDLYREYRVLAKRADQRLRELEKVSQQKGYENVTKWAYARAKRDIETFFGSGAPVRFGSATPETTQGLKAKLEDVKTFLESATSSKKKIVEMYSDRAESINKEYGSSVSWDDMAKVFESETWHRMSEEYGSDVAMLTIATAQNNGQLPDLSDSKSHAHISSGVEDVIMESLEKYGHEIGSLF